MKQSFFYLIPAILIVVSVSGCENQLSGQTKSVESQPKEVTVNTNSRPKNELDFLNRVKSESSFDAASNAAQKDDHIAAFNKYVTDSLKNISDWEMIVTEVNDNQFESTSMAKTVFDLGNNPVYNLKLAAPIKIDKSVDTIAVDNRVDFTVTVFKTPKNEMMKAQLNLIKALNKGDTVLVSGALTHLDDNAKVNFASFYNDIQTWDIDLLATSIRKKGKR